MTRKDPSQWQYPYDRMTERERREDNERLEEWRKTAEPVGSWFFPQVDDRERDR